MPCLYGGGRNLTCYSTGPSELIPIKYRRENSSAFSELPRNAPTEDLVLLGQQLETVQCCHGRDVDTDGNNSPIESLISVI